MAIERNIDKSESTAYYVIGAILIIGAILDFSKIFVILLGIALIVEAYLGWSVVNVIMDKIKNKSDSNIPPAV